VRCHNKVSVNNVGQGCSLAQECVFAWSSICCMSRVHSRNDFYIMDCDLKKMLKASQALISRLTKDAELVRDIANELLEGIEEEADDEEREELAVKKILERHGVVDFGGLFDDDEIFDYG
jgi:hypothetical protein